MKKLICLLLALTFLPIFSLAEEQTAAPEITLAWKNGSKSVDPSVLCDRSDDTLMNTSRTKSAVFTTEADEREPLSQMYVRLDCISSLVELQVLNSKKKWETVASAVSPGAEAILTTAAPVAGKLRLKVSFTKDTACRITELRCFGAGELPLEIHRWEALQTADVLVMGQSIDAIDLTELTGWAHQGRSVAVAVLSAPENPAAWCDIVYESGVRIMPLFGGYGSEKKNAAETLKSWGEKKVNMTAAGWIRRVQPLLLVTCGEIAGNVGPNAAANAANVDYESDYDEAGLWMVSQTVDASAANVGEAIASLGERSLDALRAKCAEPFANAVHSDPASIPYPANRDAEGYLTEGEFVYESPETGLWAYLSPTVQVEIIQYDTESPKHRWFAAEIKFKPEAEQFKRQVYVNASFKDQQIWPQTLAQTSKMVFAVNGDYYLARADKKSAVGNIVRDYKALYNVSKTSSWPNLDTMALHDDGSISVYDATAITADALAARGDVHDALSFGPWLVNDSRLRLYHEKNANAAEPRCAIGMISPGHYIVIDCEGRVPDGTKGLTVNETGMLLYSYGVTEAFNLDGGSTSVIIFMGEKLNRTGKDTSIGSPRNQHELFGVGTSELVHTDRVNGKPKK